jgi:hypothetical protein
MSAAAAYRLSLFGPELAVEAAQPHDATIFFPPTCK